MNQKDKIEYANDLILKPLDEKELAEFNKIKIKPSKMGGTRIKGRDASVAGILQTSSTLIDHLVRIHQQNAGTTLIIIFKQILGPQRDSPLVPPPGDIEQHRNGRDYIYHDMHVYMYTTANATVRLVNIFYPHSNFKNIADLAHPHKYIYDTELSGRRMLKVINAPDEVHDSVTMLNQTGTDPHIPLNEFCLENLQDGAINVGSCFPPFKLIENIITSENDIAVMGRYTDIYICKVINTWLRLNYNVVAFNADPYIQALIRRGENAEALLNMTRQTVLNFDNFVYNKGKLSSNIVFWLPRGPQIPACQNTIRTNVVYRGCAPYPPGAYKILNFLHTSPVVGPAITYARLSGANAVIHRITVTPNIPYWAYDGNKLISDVFQDCEIIFARCCIITTTIAARVLPDPVFGGIPVVDETIYWTNLPRPEGWVPTDGDIIGLDYIADRHREKSIAFQGKLVVLHQYPTAHAIKTADPADIFRFPGVVITYNGGKNKTKRNKKKRTKRYLKLKKNKTI
jgi:hypothetical protein